MASKLEIARQRLELYIQAEEAILGSAQSYTIGSRTLTRANLNEVRAMIDKLMNEIANLEKGGKRKVVGVIPRDF